MPIFVETLTYMTIATSCWLSSVASSLVDSRILVDCKQYHPEGVDAPLFLARSASFAAPCGSIGLTLARPLHRPAHESRFSQPAHCQVDVDSVITVADTHARLP